MVKTRITKVKSTKYEEILMTATIMMKIKTVTIVMIRMTIKIP